MTLRVTTRDQNDRVVLDFHRCALLATRGPSDDGELGAVEAALPEDGLGAVVAGWDLAALRARADAPPTAAGTSLALEAGDVVSSAAELARLSLNLAFVHADEYAAGGRRLVYGGHTIAIAASHAARALPELSGSWRGTGVSTSRRWRRATRCAGRSTSSAATPSRTAAS